MKKFVFAVVLTFASLYAAAQTYYPLVSTNKVWKVFFVVASMPPVIVHDYYKFGVENTIDGKVYRKVMITEDSVANGWGVDSYMREEAGKKVYHRYPSATSEDLIYDFSLQVGDTATFRDPSLNMCFVLDSINWVTMPTGEQRRKYTLRNILETCTETWIEGEGNIENGVVAGGSCGHIGGTLEGFWDYTIPSGINDLKESTVSIYPNPASDEFTVSFNKPVTGAILEIYDLPGKKLISLPVAGSSVVIDAKKAGLIPGTYFYRFLQPGGSPVSGKISVE
jgi:hypothetical protein